MANDFITVYTPDIATSLTTIYAVPAGADFYGMGDVTMSDAMTTYRQALRDLTNGVDTSAKARAVTYPTKP